MSSFTDPLFLSPSADRSRWLTHREFSYEIGMKGSGLVVAVPKGTKTDLASVPRALWFLVPPHDPRFAAAFVVHDYLCIREGFSRAVSDVVLYEGLRVLGASRTRALTIYLAVSAWRLFRRK